MKEHEHIRAFLMYEIEMMLNKLNARGVGFINVSYKDEVHYRIDDTIYKIKIEEKAAE